MSKFYLKEYTTELWKNSGLPQEAFSKKLGVGYSTLKGAIRGSTTLPQPSFLKALSKYEKLNELEVLKRIIYYNSPANIPNTIKINPEDFNALLLYSCYLYKKGWSFFNTIFEHETKELDFDKKHYYTYHTITNVIMKKSVYPTKSLILDNYNAWEFVGKDRMFGLWSLFEHLEDKIKSTLSNYNFKSFDLCFVYENNSKNISFINKIEKENMLKPQNCNLIKFIIFDSKKYKIIKEIVF